MPGYYITNHNPIARAGIIRKLMAKGYKLYSEYTVSDYFTMFPAATHPHVILNQTRIDLRTCVSHSEDYIKVTNVNQIPNVVDVPGRLPVFPKAAKYSMEYVKSDNTLGTYVISNPIDSNSESITAYAFGRGIRTFKKSKVRSFNKIC